MKDLETIPYDPEFEPGARNAVFTCLAVRPGERAVLITDDACLSIGAALLSQLKAARAEVSAFVLEEHVKRPTTVLPEPIARALERPTSPSSPLAPSGRAAQPHRHDRHRQPAPHPARAHSEHHAAHHGGGDARRLPRVDALCRWVLGGCGRRAP
jgi:hypothetical protein